MTNAIPHRLEIDGLRAIAVISVMLHHAGFTTFSGGFVGVDVFFVISGYLITSIILSQLAAGRFSLCQFYQRRIRRIVPALCVVTLSCMPFAWLWFTPRDLKEFSQSIIAVASFVPNIFFFLKSGYFETASELKPLLHTWSLGVEEQFYFLFPLLCMIIWKYKRAWLFTILGAFFLISLAIAEYSAHHYTNFAFYLLPSRIWELLTGVIIALPATPVFLSKSPLLQKKHAQNILSAMGLCAILLSITLYDKSTPLPGLHALLPTLGTACILTFTTNTSLTYRLLCLKPLTAIGLISYSAYLWHQPILAFARYHETEPLTQATLLGLIAFILALSFLSWRFIEIPFRKSQRLHVSARKTFGIYAIITMALIALGVYGIQAHNAPNRLNARVLEAANTATASPKREECHTGGAHYLAPERGCIYPGKTAQWAVFGDSHAVELAYALSKALSETNPDAGVLHLSFSGCNPHIADDPNLIVAGCHAWTKQAMSHLINNPEIENIVVSYRIAAALFGDHAGTYPQFPNTTTKQEKEAMWQGLKSQLTAFTQAGKRVYYILQAPELRTDINNLIKYARNHANVTGVSRAWWDRRIAYVTNRLNELPEHVILIDPAAFLCDQKDCFAIKDGKSLYFDDDHLSVFGARKIVDLLIKK